MSNARLGLEFDISPFRKGVVNAAKLVGKGLNDRTFKPANQAVQKLAYSMKKRLGGAVSYAAGKVNGLTKALFSIKGLVAGILGAAVIGKGIQFLSGAIAASRELADSAVVLERAIRSSGESLKSRQFKGIAEDLSLQLGVGESDVNKTAASFLTRGFSAEATKELTILAANASKVYGTTVVDAGKKMADALNGGIDAAKELGIEFASTGDAIKDKIILAEKLQAQFGTIGSELVNPSEQLKANLDNITATIGETVLPMFDPIISYINNILTAWKEGSMDKDLMNIVATLEGIIAGVRQIIDVIGQIYSQAKAQVTAIFSLGILLVDGLTASISSGIPAMIQTLVKLAVDTLLETLGGSKVGRKLLDKIGINESLSESLGTSIEQNKADFGDAVSPSLNAFKEIGGAALDEYKKTWRVITGNETDTLTGNLQSKLDELAAKGEAINTAAQDRLNNRPAINPQDLLSKKTLDEQRNAAAKEKNEAAGKSNSRLASNSNVGDGQKIGISIISRKPDQFRKVALK